MCFFTHPFCVGHCTFRDKIQSQNFNIYNINEVIIQTQKHMINKLFSEENKVPRTLFFKLKTWQGPPHINKIRQYETMMPSNVSLFIQGFFPHLKLFVLYKLGIKKSVSLLIKMSSLKLHSAPLKYLNGSRTNILYENESVIIEVTLYRS